MENAKTFQNLQVWQAAHQFVLAVYKVSEHFPDNEKFVLTSQFRRAAVSVAANIAEGFSKISIKNKIRFYNIAKGSLEECRFFLILIKDLKYADTNELNENLEKTSKLLNAYSKALRSGISDS